MNIIKKSVVLVAVFITVFMVSGYTEVPLVDKKIETVKAANQTINMFVTHGHCSTPFAGKVNDLKVEYPTRLDLGNPLEDMVISFEVDPNSFNVCKAEELTPRIKTPGLFISEKNEKITFISTNVYTMGVDWYQVNGKMSIKGVEKDVKLFVTGIRKPNEQVATSLVLDGQVNLFDWGIDYDLIVNGKSSSVATKWLYLNMKIELL